MKQVLIILFLSLLIKNSKAQDYTLFSNIGASEEYIKERIIHEGGVMQMDKFVHGGFYVPSHKELNFKFPKGIPENGEIYFAKFYVSKNNHCFQYDIWYRTDKSIKKLIEQLGDKKLGWMRKGANLEWVSNPKIMGSDNFEIRILRFESKNIKGAPFYVFQMNGKII